MKRSSPNRNSVGLSAQALMIMGLSLVIFQVPTNAQSRVDDPIRIMAMGDSITGSPGCWRAILWRDLVAAGLDNVDLVGSLEPDDDCDTEFDGEHEGHGGITADTVADLGLANAWLVLNPADVLLIHLGTNDVWQSIHSTEEILDHYTLIVEQAREANPRIKILLAQIIPIGSEACPTCSDRIIDLNAAIPDWAEVISTAESPVWAVDQWTGFNVDVDTYDGVHPNDSGDRKIASRWLATLVSVLAGDAILPPTDTAATATTTTTTITTALVTTTTAVGLDSAQEGYPAAATGALALVVVATGTVAWRIKRGRRLARDH